MEGDDAETAAFSAHTKPRRPRTQNAVSTASSASITAYEAKWMARISAPAEVCVKPAMGLVHTNVW
eukprot:5355916-Pleurochrysis_carterae.AAC.1